MPQCGQFVAERLGHVELVEVRRQPKVESPGIELVAEQAVARSRLKQPGRIKMADRRGVPVSLLANVSSGLLI
jgi:hypothetical protein